MAQQDGATTHTSPKFTEALAYAVTAHSLQARKGSQIPYASHILAVCALVMEDGGSEEEAIAALLHDVIEDCEKTRDELASLFGTTVADVVEACSDSKVTIGKRPWTERKKGYLTHLREERRDGVLRVSCADKLHNARSVLVDYRTHAEALWGRFNACGDCQIWYYRELVDAFSTAWGSERPLVVALGAVVGELARITGRMNHIALHEACERSQATREATKHGTI